MGKKSKKKAAKPLPQDAGKNVRCFECFGTVKVSEGKGHKCPGCSEMFCQRCEKKKFCPCPNGEHCAFSCERCINCIGGKTMVKVLKEMGAEYAQSDLSEISETIDPGASPRNQTFRCSVGVIDTFKKVIESSDKLSLDAVPIQFCGGREGKCLMSDCERCLNGSEVKNLYRCHQCKKVRCFECCIFNPSAINTFATDAMRDGLSPIHAAAAAFRCVSPHTMQMCGSCNTRICNECASPRYLEAIGKSYVALCNKIGGIPLNPDCDACYYAKKPCTNPTCPNEVGVPTKRCGGCHISRYCSKECQAADSPGHLAKCQKMQVKLAAKALKREKEAYEHSNVRRTKNFSALYKSYRNDGLSTADAMAKATGDLSVKDNSN